MLQYAFFVLIQKEDIERNEKIIADIAKETWDILQRKSKK